MTIKALFRATLILACLTFMLAGQKVKETFPILKGPYLGQKPPGTTPEIFTPDESYLLWCCGRVKTEKQ